MDPQVSTDDAGGALANRFGERSLILGVDIGGTKIAAGVVDIAGQVMSFVVQPTPTDADAEGLLDVVVALAERACEGYVGHVVAVGVGCGGPMIYPAGIVSPLFIPAWQSFPLRARLESSLSLPVVLDNDANAFALGEAMFGVGQGARYLLGMIISTGIGGGIVADGRVYHGATGNAGHIGHVNVSAEGPRCSCGAIGCLTAYASGTGLVARARAGVLGGMNTTLATVADDALTGQAIVEAAASGDPFATHLLRDAGLAVGRGIVDAASLLDLDRVVLGGGLIQAGELLLAPMRAEVRDRAKLPFTRHIDIRITATGREAGVIGAAALCL